MDLTKESFKEIISQTEKPVLIDFWAPWCGPCRMQGPILSEAQEFLADSAIVAKVNIDENEELAEEYGVMSIPTLMVFKNGEIEAKSVGVTSKEAIISMVLDGENKDRL